MNFRQLFPCAAALVLGLAACKSQGKEAGEEHEVAVEHAPAISLAAGIAAAQKSEAGQFLAAEIENEGGKVICSVVLAQGDGAHEINVDATTGKVLNTENETLGPHSHALLQELAKDPKKISSSVAQAIEAALKKVPGSWALEAKLKSEGGALVYEITLAGGKEPMLAQVSASDGTVKKVSELEEDEADEKH